MTDPAPNPVQVARRGAILLATVDNPPVNALSHAVRAGLAEAVERLAADTEARALAIVCAGRTFMAGADIREFGAPLRDPQLGAVIAAIEAAGKPVVAAMHGSALGGGLEVALACHARVAAPDAKLGLPEVKLGTLPGSGGCVRLPRLVGVEKALAMIADGRPIGAREALEAGLVDAIVEGELAAGAVAFAARLAASGEPPRRTSALPVPPFDSALFETSRAAFAKRFRGLEAPLAAVDLVEMATRTPVEEALRRELATCRALLGSPQSQALRHVFAAERAAGKIEGLPAATGPRPIERVAVVGPGTMGVGIATAFLDADIPVTLIGLGEDGLAAAVAAIRRGYDGQVRRGALAAEAAERRLGRLATTCSYDGLGDVDLAVETVTEDLETKRGVIAALDAALGDGAIVATNTSFLDIDAIAAASRRPENLVGMHFFNPANVMKLLENVRATRTAPDVLATVMALGRRLGKVPVLVGRSEGFVANRMLSKRTREAQFLVQEGASPADVDRVLTGFGFPLGPFALADLAGLDVVAATRASRLPRMSERERGADLVDRLVAAGRLGQKSGAGWYAYDDKRKPVPDPAVDALIEAHRRERGFAARAVGDDEILERCLYAMVNEAARILEEGAAARPGDIDVIWTSGFGFPAWRGGPMWHADAIGLGTVAAALRRYAATVGSDYFAPAASIERLAADGRGFYG